MPIGGAVATGTTTTAVVGTQSVEYRDAGVVLTVTPRIGERGTVALDVKQEVNDIGNQFFGTTGSPTIIKREAETSVVLLNNQTLILGGLIKDKRDRTTRVRQPSRAHPSRWGTLGIGGALARGEGESPRRTVEYRMETLPNRLEARRSTWGL